MMINGYRLPDLLSQCLRDGTLERDQGSWQLKADQDAFGQCLETELGEVFTAEIEIEAETARLEDNFAADGVYGEDDPSLQGPGAIADILDFTHIVCFGISGDGSPFCLDYRDNPTEPSVIWWDDCYWRRIAPDFETFLSLFDLES